MCPAPSIFHRSTAPPAGQPEVADDCVSVPARVASRSSAGPGARSPLQVSKPAHVSTLVSEYGTVASALPCRCSTLTELAGWQVTCDAYPASATMLVSMSARSHAIRYAIYAPFEWPIA